MLGAVQRLPGEKHVELELGVARNGDTFSATGYDSPDAWYRGVADFVGVDVANRQGFLIDYKTSKSARYADERQLALLAGATFLHFPALQRIKAALVFVVSNEIVVRNYVRSETPTLLTSFDPMLDRLHAARATNVWNPIDGPLCAFCPVTACAYNRKDTR